MRKLFAIILFVSGCASKPVIVKDCQKVEGDQGLQVCSKI
jgi:hypothetical protein